MGLILMSYVCQWISHRVEGNDMGGVVLVKRLLGRPAVAISPRFRTNAARKPTSSEGARAT